MHILTKGKKCSEEKLKSTTGKMSLAYWLPANLALILICKYTTIELY